jgi:hypothetical protein
MVNEQYVERATGLSSVTFAAAVTLLTFATFAPMVLNQEGIASRCGVTICLRKIRLSVTIVFAPGFDPCMQADHRHVH